MSDVSRYRREAYAEEYDNERFGGTFGRYLRDKEAEVFLSLAGGSPEKILDVGAGTGKIALALTHVSSQAFALDASLPMLRVAWRKSARDGRSLSLIAGDAQRLCFKDRAFDCAVSSRLLMHLPEWRQGIAEMCRVAEKTVIVDFPPVESFAGLDCRSAQRLLWWDKKDHTYRALSVKKVIRELEKNGFRLVALRKGFFLPLALYRLLDSPRFSQWMEALFGRLGLVRLLGAPVTIKATRRNGQRERP